MVEAQLLTKISIVTGQETEEGGLPADFRFQCIMPDDSSLDELAEWISCYFDSRGIKH